MTAGHTTIARVDASLARARRWGRVDLVALVTAGLLVTAAAIIVLTAAWPPRELRTDSPHGIEAQ